MIFSALLVFGPVTCQHLQPKFGIVCILTNCANDAGTAIVLFRCIVDVEAGMPFHLGSVVQVVKSITHLDRFARSLELW